MDDGEETKTTEGWRPREEEDVKSESRVVGVGKRNGVLDDSGMYQSRGYTFRVDCRGRVLHRRS